MVRKALWDDGTVRSVADLKGRKVAINSKGSAVEYWFYAALAQGGLTPNDVDVVVLPFQDAIAAMANGALDGALIGEPDVTRAELDGAHRPADRGLRGRFPGDGASTSTRPSLQNDHREAMQQFLAAYLHGARDLGRATATATREHRDPRKVHQVPSHHPAVARTPFHDPDGNVHVADFQKLQDFFVTQGVATPIDMNAVVDPSYAEAPAGPAGAAATDALIIVP